MKNALSWFACSALIVLCWCGTTRAQNVRPGVEKEQRRGGIATMYWLDPLTRALCFHDGRAGLMIQNDRLENRCSDLSFTTAGGGSLVIGIEANRVGAIIDLGTADELRERYGFEDAAAGGEGFASLRLQDGKFMILKEDGPPEQLQPLKESQTLFVNVRSSANAPIKLGHIYLLHLADKKDSSFQQFVKLIVIAYRPNESVTLRWALL